MEKSSFRKNGDWQDNDEHQGEDRPLPTAFRVVLWLMFASAFAMGGYGIYGWVTQQLIPVAQRLAQPMPARPPLSAHVTAPAKTTQPQRQQPTLVQDGQKPSEDIAGVPSPDAPSAATNP